MSETVTVSGSDASGTSVTTTNADIPAMIAPHRVVRAPLRWVRERAQCVCRGEMVCTGSGITPGVGPTRWRHRCTECGAVAAFALAYPRDVAEVAQ